MKKDRSGPRRRGWLFAGAALAFVVIVVLLAIRWWGGRAPEQTVAKDMGGIVVAAGAEVTRADSGAAASPSPAPPSVELAAPGMPDPVVRSVAAMPAALPCPENLPAEGSACTHLPAGMAQTCGYGAGAKARVCICDAVVGMPRRWKCQGTESVVVGECPKKQPAAGSACPSQGRTCEYEDDDEDDDDKDKGKEEQGELLCVCDLTSGWSCHRELERGGK